MSSEIIVDLLLLSMRTEALGAGAKTEMNSARVCSAEKVNWVERKTSKDRDGVGDQQWERGNIFFLLEDNEQSDENF